MNEIHELDERECRRLLAGHTVGRIALATEAGPTILPVSYAMSGDAIVFRTLPYGVIANHAHGAVVAFEVDELVEEMRSGWSVVAVGRCARVEEPEEVRTIREGRDPEPWAAGQRILYLRIEVQQLTGRRIGVPASSTAEPSAAPSGTVPEPRREAVGGSVSSRDTDRWSASPRP